MPNPPSKKTTQSDYIKTSLRVPPDLHEDLVRTAESQGHSLNQEILLRLRAGQARVVLSKLDEMYVAIRKILDAVT